MEVIKTSNKSNISNKLKNPIDWSGQKYFLLKNIGYDVNIYFCQIDLKNKSYQYNWYDRCHSLSDGVGAFSDLQTQLSGHKCQQPHHQKIKKPHLIKQFWQLGYYLWSSRPIPYQWKNKSSDASPTFSENIKTDSKTHSAGLEFNLDDCVSIICFDKDMTEQLLQSAKSKSVSINSLLLWSLDRIARESLLSNNELRAWLIPVNMRGGLKIENPSFNYTASLNLRLNKKSDLKSIDRQIKKLYSQGQQWGAWLYSNFNRYFPQWCIQLLFKKYKSCWLGVFSNLGSWSSAEDSQNIQWSIISPATPYNPIASEVLTWNNKLTLSLRIHPSILKGDNLMLEINLIAQKWCELLKKQCDLNGSPNINTFSLKEITSNCKQF